MPWRFSLAVECGEDSAAAPPLIQALSPQLPPHTHSLYAASDGALWVSFWLEGHREEDASTTTLAESLLHHLSHYAGAYRFALAGVEVHEARTWAEVQEEAQQGALPLSLVLSAQSYAHLGQPAKLQPFGRAWRSMPY